MTGQSTCTEEIPIIDVSGVLVILTSLTNGTQCDLVKRFTKLMVKQHFQHKDPDIWVGLPYKSIA